VALWENGSQGLTASCANSRPQMALTPGQGQGVANLAPTLRRDKPTRLHARHHAVYSFARLRASLSRSRSSWFGASSSIFHRTACASPSVSYSLRSTVPSSSNSTRAQLNKADHPRASSLAPRAYLGCVRSSVLTRPIVQGPLGLLPPCDRCGIPVSGRPDTETFLPSRISSRLDRRNRGFDARTERS